MAVASFPPDPFFAFKRFHFVNFSLSHSLSLLFLSRIYYFIFPNHISYSILCKLLSSCSIYLYIYIFFSLILCLSHFFFLGCSTVSTFFISLGMSIHNIRFPPSLTTIISICKDACLALRVVRKYARITYGFISRTYLDSARGGFH